MTPSNLPAETKNLVQLANSGLLKYRNQPTLIRAARWSRGPTAGFGCSGRNCLTALGEVLGNGARILVSA